MNLTNALPESLGAYLRGEGLAVQTPWTPEEVQRLLDAAMGQRLLPMVYEAVRDCPALRPILESAPLAPYKQRVLQQIMAQATRTAEAAALLTALATAGLHPVVAKGVVCRELYPLPDARSSGDEDWYISPAKLAPIDEILQANGMQPHQKGPASMDSDEHAYLKTGGMLYLELHTALFDPTEDSCGDFNALFDGWESRAVTRTVAGCDMLVMDHTDHLLYLLLHAFKHFVHCGVGLRQACDIALYANAYGGEVDWARIQSACRRVYAEGFATAVLAIGRRYFGLQDEAAHIPADWHRSAAEPDDLLADMVEGGVYGYNNGRQNDRVFVAAAATTRRNGKSRSAFSIMWHKVFLPYQMLAEFFPYLHRCPLLVPVAWVQRTVRLAKKVDGVSGLRATMSHSSGRIDLLKKYGAA